MIFAQFYSESTGYVPGSMPPAFDDAYKTLIEACGDRSVIVIDGRLSGASIGRIAADECQKRGFIAWRIFIGEAFTRCTPVSMLHRVYSREDKSAQSAALGA